MTWFRIEAPVWFSLHWPREVALEGALGGLLALAGMATPRRRDTVILQAVGTAQEVAHHAAVSARRAGALRRQLEAAMPGLVMTELTKPPEVRVDRSWRLWLSNQRRPLDQQHSEVVARAILTALSAVGTGERLVLQWRLGPTRPPASVGRQAPGSSTASIGSVLLAPLLPPGELDAEDRKLLRHKRSLPGWKADLRIGVRARGRDRQHQLLGRLTAAVHMAQAPGVQLGFRPTAPTAVDSGRLPWWWPVAIQAAEARGLVGWPLGDTEDQPVERSRSRRLPVPRSVPSRGRVVAVSAGGSRSRPVALSAADSLQHLHVIGPTGVGKSTLLLNLICQDMATGRAVVVVEPKGDLVEDVLARVPQDRLDDVVLMDPSDDAPVGLNPLAQGHGPPELAVDQLLAVFKGLFGDAIGPRTQDLLTAGLATLAAGPRPTLVALPLLFTDEAFRRRAVARVSDPLALDPFWAWFEALSVGERGAVLAPMMNKLRAFLLRPHVRRVIGQAEPRFDVRQVFTERRILLVNLAKGSVGGEAASLLGSLVVSQLWQATLQRHRLPPERRHATFVYVDEFQDYLHLPTDLADVLSQARGLGVGLHLAHQHLGQLTPTVRAAVLANARSRVIFQTGADDARALIGSDSRLTPADLAGLGRYQAYASLVAGGEVTPYASVSTLPPPPETRKANEARTASRHRWGAPAQDTEAALARLVEPLGSDDQPTFGIVPRRDGGPL